MDTLVFSGTPLQFAGLAVAANAHEPAETGFSPYKVVVPTCFYKGAVSTDLVRTIVRVQDRIPDYDAGADEIAWIDVEILAQPDGYSRITYDQTEVRAASARYGEYTNIGEKEQSRVKRWWDKLIHELIDSGWIKNQQNVEIINAHNLASSPCPNAEKTQSGNQPKTLWEQRWSMIDPIISKTPNMTYRQISTEVENQYGKYLEEETVRNTFRKMGQTKGRGRRSCIHTLNCTNNNESHPT